MQRRIAIKTLMGAFPFLRAAGTLTVTAAAPAPSATLPSRQGPFQPTHESLARYEVPRWFRDAKFGIWAHWGPQSAAEAGDWYARNMYMQGSPQYQHHLEHYGHPSLTAEDVRFTTKGDVLFAFVMGVPEKRALLAPLTANSASGIGKVEHVELLGFPGKLTWRHEQTGLAIELPQTKPCRHALAFKIHGAVQE